LARALDKRCHRSPHSINRDDPVPPAPDATTRHVPNPSTGGRRRSSGRSAFGRRARSPGESVRPLTFSASEALAAGHAGGSVFGARHLAGKHGVSSGGRTRCARGGSGTSTSALLARAPAGCVAYPLHCHTCSSRNFLSSSRAIRTQRPAA
jgi:hypothetical protein